LQESGVDVESPESGAVAPDDYYEQL
jgi:hypothetical protein